MAPEFIAQLPSLGISGLLFVMWWNERQERARGTVGLRDALQYAREVAETNKSLLEVIRTNTTALVELRDELRIHRASESELLSRVARQFEEMVGV